MAAIVRLRERSIMSIYIGAIDQRQTNAEPSSGARDPAAQCNPNPRKLLDRAGEIVFVDLESRASGGCDRASKVLLRKHCA